MQKAACGRLITIEFMPGNVIDFVLIATFGEVCSVLNLRKLNCLYTDINTSHTITTLQYNHPKRQINIGKMIIKTNGGKTLFLQYTYILFN